MKSVREADQDFSLCLREWVRSREIDLLAVCDWNEHVSEISTGEGGIAGKDLL